MNPVIDVQPTPNPQALKFILENAVASGGAATYKDAAGCAGNQLAKILLGLEHVREVYFNENFITVTQDGQADWEALENKVQTVITENIASHNPDSVVTEAEPLAKDASHADPEVASINAILDSSVRPFLQRDGGDVQIVAFADNVLKIHYQGACGGCPSAAFGTLRAIENVLREQYRPDIKVELA